MKKRMKSYKASFKEALHSQKFHGLNKGEYALKPGDFKEFSKELRIVRKQRKAKGGFI